MRGARIIECARGASYISRYARSADFHGLSRYARHRAPGCVRGAGVGGLGTRGPSDVGKCARGADFPKNS